MLERSVALRTILFARCWHPPYINNQYYDNLLGLFYNKIKIINLITHEIITN